MLDRHEYTELLNLATDIGYGLLHNGAEIYRVEDSIRRIFSAYELPYSDVFTIPSCILITINDGEHSPLTRVRRVTVVTTNIHRIEQYNRLCRMISATTPPLSVIREGIRAIEEEKQYSFPVLVLATAFVSCSFTLFYGGGWRESCVAFVCGLALRSIMHLLHRRKTNDFFNNIICGALVSVIAVLASYFRLAPLYDTVIIGTLMNLVPGIAITNVMRDIINGDLLSGTIKFVEAILVALGIALGAGLAITVLRQFILF